MVGVKVAKRAKQHVAAALMFIVQFLLRKVNRKTYHFKGNDEDYNMCLDHVFEGF